MRELLAEMQKPMPVDITPLIDCVFLLLIFFALVVDLSQQNLEDLTLATARTQQPDTAPPRHRPVLNVLPDGSIAYKGRIFYDRRRDGADRRPVLELLQLCRATLPGGRTETPTDVPLLIRPDRWTEWSEVRALVAQCRAAGFQRLELALADAEPTDAPEVGR